MTAAMVAPITRRRCGRCGGTEQNYDLMELIQSSLIKSVSADGFEESPVTKYRFQSETEKWNK